ncbi:MAG TPA: glycosyltransferase family 4 protein [Pararhizobium sp.]|uniref:glycosyltransferase family 4 protein n=1 Tax=Pararhizobium sp. TaxID=1977563 RepID=UPI002B6B3F80|nr:glycosyltransferase family 4 protein [Pararhizobium sp.]HTO31592.1 glycosyltransferase family 4 protein [Pararhizobium sp.]
MTQHRKIIVVLKGYPRLSETFIAQELLGLERAGFELTLVALRRPTDKKRHPVHDEIRAPVHYLPEYLHEEVPRVLRALATCLPKPGFWRALPALITDFRRDRTRNRIRRFGQAMVLSAEWPKGGEWLHAHFIHTPASVARYASIISGTPWTCSAHAKDIWTSPDWELRGKLASTRWTVTCTQTGYEHLRHLSGGKPNVHLSYHGLDLTRFGEFDDERPPFDGSRPEAPVTIVSVGRAVEKKGFDIVLRALSLLPKDLHWQFEHIGGGEQLAKLQTLAKELGIADNVSWHGSMSQQEVLQHYRNADIFALACRITADGDRDGLPNVLVEASSQKLACISTNISGVPELLVDGENGFVVPPEDPQAFAAALERAIRDPALRARLGEAAERKVRREFDHQTSIRQLKQLFEAEWQKTR